MCIRDSPLISILPALTKDLPFTDVTSTDWFYNDCLLYTSHDAGILTVAVVTKPFRFEGANRMKQAEAGIANLTDKVDSMIIIPNDRLKFVTDQKITFANAFGIADDVLKQAVSSISELVGYSENVIINLDFADVSAIMRNAGQAHMGVGSATGRDKAAVSYTHLFQPAA